MIDQEGIERLRLRAEAVRGRVMLSAVIGKPVALRRAGREWDGLCPFHADKKIGSFKVNDDKGLYKCFSCGANGDVIGFVEAHRGLSFIEALRLLESDAGIDAAGWDDPAKRQEAAAARAARDAEAQADGEKRRKKAAALWHGAAAIERTPAAAYLATRGIDVSRLPAGKWPSSLRFCPDLWCRELADAGASREGSKMAGMVAGIWRIDRGGDMVGCHRTFLDISEYDHGRKSGVVRKARLTDAKLTMGPSLGGYIPLNKGRHRQSLADLPAGVPVLISEGIEDGLSVAMGAPEARIIAGVSLSKLGALMLPPQCREIVFIAQRDPEGSAAADSFEKATAEQQRLGRTVKWLWPPEGFKDWNDWLLGKQMAGVT